MNIEKYVICTISDMGDYVGDFVISGISNNHILAYPVLETSMADEAQLSEGVRALSRHGRSIIIDVLSPQRFYSEQIEAIFDTLSQDAVSALEIYKTYHLSRTALKNKAVA